MCKQYLFLICSLAVVCFTESAPPPFTKCKSEDSKCMKETTKAFIPIFSKGFPEYNVPTLDPLQIKIINATEGNLLFVLSDVTAVGLSNCEPKKVERNVAKSKLFLTILCSGKLDGQYELKGSLLFVPIEGNGAIHVDLNSVLVNIEFDLVDKVGEDGKEHWHVKSWTHSFELKDKSNVVFENLYNGNEVLGRAARELVANNSNDVIMEIGPKVIKGVAAKIVKYINNFFKALPIEDLVLS